MTAAQAASTIASPPTVATRDVCDSAAEIAAGPATVAVIGLGYWGPNLVRNFRSVLGDDLRICCDASADRVEAVRKNFPGLDGTTAYDDVLADPSITAVAIATPVDTHYPLAKAALEAGKHVLVEKPMAANVSEARELVALAAEQQRVLMVDHVFVFSPPVRKMKDLLDAGELGDLLFVDSVRVNLGKFQRDVNVVWDLAPHDLSIIDYLVGRSPVSVAAFGSAHTPNGQEDVAYVNLDYGDGLIANFHVNWLSPVKIRYTMLGGNRKSLIYNDLEPSEKIKIYDSGVTVHSDTLNDRREILVDYRTGDIWSPHVSQGEPLRTMAQHFVTCIREGQTPISDGRAGLRIVQLLDAAERSIKAQGGRITL